MAKKGRAAGKSSRWRDLQLAALVAVGPPVAYAVLWLLVRTLRIEIEGLDAVRERWRRGERVVLTFWHGRQLAVAMAVPRVEARPCILVSRHRDGEIATRLLRYWGVATVRGSTSSGAVAGLRGVIKAFRDGYDIAFAPDGPRGPSGDVKLGVLHVAKTSGAELVPVGAAGDRVWRLRSWDRMIIPKPFSRLLLLAGAPISTAPDVDAERIDELRQSLRGTLDNLTETAETRMRRSSP